MSNLYTRQNMAYACSMSMGLPTNNELTTSCADVTLAPNSTVPFYYGVTLDPNGALFGRSPCGVLNFMRFNQCYP